MLALRPPSGLAVVGNPAAEPVILPLPPPKRIVHLRISFEKYPFHEAIATGEPRELIHQRLIAQPSLLESADGYGRTPLIVACLYGDRQVVRLLLDLGANTKARSYDGRTPLIHAARRGDAAIAQDLLQSGADKNATDTTDLDAFFSAMVCGHAMPFLRPEGDINAPRSSRIMFADVFAQTASLRGFDVALSLATMFVAVGGNIQLPGRHACPPLGYAVERADVKAIRALPQLGGCINCCDQRAQLIAAKSPAVLAALNAAWDTFLEQLKGVAPDTHLRALPPDMLRYLLRYLRPQRAPEEDIRLLAF